jgi:reverse gyrase
MQRVHISPGKALCRFCGRNISMNRLSTHIAKEHCLPGQRDMAPTLVRTRKALAPTPMSARRPA